MLSLPHGVVQLLSSVLDVYAFILIARALLSWFPPSKNKTFSQIAQFIHQVTEPVLSPIRKIIPSMGGIDLSILIVFFGIQILQRILFGI